MQINFDNLTVDIPQDLVFKPVLNPASLLFVVGPINHKFWVEQAPHPDLGIHGKYYNRIHRRMYNGEYCRQFYPTFTEAACAVDMLLQQLENGDTIYL